MEASYVGWETFDHLLAFYLQVCIWSPSFGNDIWSMAAVCAVVNLHQRTSHFPVNSKLKSNQSTESWWLIHGTWNVVCVSGFIYFLPHNKRFITIRECSHILHANSYSRIVSLYILWYVVTRKRINYQQHTSVSLGRVTSQSHQILRATSLGGQRHSLASFSWIQGK